MRASIWGAVLSIMMIGCGPSPASPDADETASFDVQCAAGRSLVLALHDQALTVTLADRTLELVRRPSSVGQYYAGAGATLIMDDGFVAFVPDGDDSWRNCRISDGRVASID